MIKFLMAIVLLVIGAKHISGYSIFNYGRYNSAELTMQDESGQENGEKDNTKKDNEVKIFPHAFVYPLLNIPTKPLQFSWHQDAYLGFVNSPNTPPPNRV